MAALPDDQLPPPYTTATPNEPSKSAEALDNPISRQETEPLPPYQKDDANPTSNDESAEGDQAPKEKPKWYRRGGVLVGTIEVTLIALVFALVT